MIRSNDFKVSSCSITYWSILNIVARHREEESFYHSVPAAAEASCSSVIKVQCVLDSFEVIFIVAFR